MVNSHITWNRSYLKDFRKEAWSNLLQVKVIKGIKRCNCSSERRARGSRNSTITKFFTITYTRLRTIIITTPASTSSTILQKPLPYLGIRTSQEPTSFSCLIQVRETLSYRQHLRGPPLNVPFRYRTLVLHSNCWSRTPQVYHPASNIVLSTDTSIHNSHYNIMWRYLKLCETTLLFLQKRIWFYSTVTFTYLQGISASGDLQFLFNQITHSSLFTLCYIMLYDLYSFIETVHWLTTRVRVKQRKQKVSKHCHLQTIHDIFFYQLATLRVNSNKVGIIVIV